MRTIAGLVMLSAAIVGAGCATAQAPSDAAPQDRTWRGVDLSYVNELEACGARYRDETGYQDPYAILARAGANVVRLRLWHSPDWTAYSTLEDVRQSISRAKANNMKVLLDFHYSDDWVHPGKQIVPKAWAGQADDELAASLGTYTKSVLRSLDQDGLLPDYVQIGNETNTDMLIDKEVAETAPINWQRNVKFVLAGVTAVRTVEKQTGKAIRVMLHVAQPENIEPWLDAAASAGLPDFDIIGLSYYEKWSSMPLAAIGPKVARLRAKYGKDVVIVETAYPWTLKWNDQMGNLLGEDSLSPGYEASPEGQRRYLVQLQQSVTANGGLGIVYWEPAWISSSCTTRWGTGSSWENTALFDFKGRLLPGAAFLNPEEGR